MSAPRACREPGHEQPGSAWRDLSADVDAFLRASFVDIVRKRGTLKQLSTLATPSLLAIAFYRFSHLAHLRGFLRASRLIAGVNYLLHKVTISPSSCIGGGLHLPHPVGVIFFGSAGSDLTLSAESACFPDQPLFSSSAEDGPSLGDRVFLGAQSFVIGRIVVGSDTRLAPRAFLTRDAPNDSVVASRVFRMVVSHADRR